MHSCAQVSVDDLFPLRAVDVVNPLITCVGEAADAISTVRAHAASVVATLLLLPLLSPHFRFAPLSGSAVGFGNYDFNANPLSCFGTVLCNYQPGGKQLPPLQENYLSRVSLPF